MLLGRRSVFLACYNIFVSVRDFALRFLHKYRGRVLGRNWDKSLQSFPSCYSQSPLLTYCTPPLSPLSKSGLKLVCTLNIIFGNQVWELSRLCPETSMKLYVHESGFWMRIVKKVSKYSVKQIKGYFLHSKVLRFLHQRTTGKYCKPSRKSYISWDIFFNKGCPPPLWPPKNIYEQQIRDSFWFVNVQD